MFGRIGIGACVVFNLISSGPCFSANPYQMGQVDYFNSKIKKALDKTKKEETFDFREPAIGADGKLTFYTPPSAVLKLLEAPTPSNARAYLAWQKGKMARIIEAQHMIDQVIKEEERP